MVGSFKSAHGNVRLPEEYESARSTVLNAHYTSPVVIKAMYEAVKRMDFAPGNILEPSCGIGNFFGLVYPIRQFFRRAAPFLETQDVRRHFRARVGFKCVVWQAYCPQKVGFLRQPPAHGRTGAGRG